MGLSITNVATVESRKRVEATVKFEYGLFGGIFGGDPEYTAKFRIVSPDPLPEGSEEEWLRKIHEQRSEWKPGKKSKWVRLANSNATGYVLDYSEELETEGKDTTETE